MRLKLNGWQRLWVVAASLYFVVVCGFGVYAFPDGSSLEAERANFAVELALRAQVDAARTAGDERSELNALRDLKKGAAQVRSEAYGDLANVELMQRIRSKFDGKVDFKALDEKVRLDTERLRSDRFGFLLLTVAWWIVPVLALYALGWAAGWVIRGFRRGGDV